MFPISDVDGSVVSSLPERSQGGPFKNILAHLPLDDSAEGVTGAAVSIARLFSAHIDGVVAVEQPDSQQRPSAIGSTGLQVIADFENTMRIAAHTLGEFETAAEQAGLSHDERVIVDKPDLIEQTLLWSSRLYDLSVVAQPWRTLTADAQSTPKAMLFDSGRPVMLIPREHRGGIILERIAICWDGSRHEARRVHDAMPLLESTRSIDIIA